MVKMYDSLMKSGKFTAAQNKTENGEVLSSISELAELCERQGFIPRYYSPQPNDQVDATIADLKGYTRSLIQNERDLGSLIENAVKAMTEQENKEEDDDDIDDVENYLASLEQELNDSDFSDFEDFKDAEAEATQQLLDEREAAIRKQAEQRKYK